MSGPRQLPVIILGAGRVGRAFLAQLTHAREHFAARYGIALCPVALADRSGAIFEGTGFSPEAAAAVIARKTAGEKLAQQPGGFEVSGRDLIAYCLAQGLQGALLVDTTTGETGDLLRYALAQGYDLVLANKRPLADFWREARVLYDSPRVRFEATVGAGLPVVATLRYLIDTGDVVRHIEGALSGTLGFVCSQLEDGEAFSLAVNRASEYGYSEFDPRDDLSGMDAARKVLILARIAGWHQELHDLRIDPLIPVELNDLSLPEFRAALPGLDAEVAATINTLGGVPRYMADIDPAGGNVALRMVGEKQAAQLRGTLNRVSFTTARYADIPLTIMGPGAGPEVTAAAVLQDCLSLAISAATRARSLN